MIRLYIYILAMLPIIWELNGLGRSFDPYDQVIAASGRWMSIWLIVLLTLGPIMRTFRIRSQQIGRQPIGIAVGTWALIHVAGYFLFHAQAFNQAALQIITKPFLVLGGIAFVMIMILTATSYQKAIRWLGKKWKVIHQLSLWAAILGSSHGLVAQKIAINEFGFYSLMILIICLWRSISNLRKA